MREMFDSHEGILRGASPDQFVELRLDSGAVAILDEEDHREGHDRRPRIDDELPCVGEAEERSACGPNDDNDAADQKG